MDWPPRATEILSTLYRQNSGLTTGTREQQELFMRLVAEQLAFEMGPLWGVKSAGAGRPQGPSQIAYNDPSGLGGWRVIDGDGSVTGTPGAPIPSPIWQLFPGQMFLSVNGVDHLKTAEPKPPDPPPPQQPAPDTLALLLIRVAAMEDHLAGMAHDLSVILNQIDLLKRAGYPVYSNGWLTLEARIPKPK